MNINIVLRCNTCSKTTHCRIGVSYKKNQSLRFACPTCMSPIDVLLKYQTSIMDTSLSWEGAEPADNQTLSEADHFVDLHLDFPTYYGEYEPGITPFIRATRVIGFEDIQNFVFRIQILDQRAEEADEIKNIIRFYVAEKWDLFRENVHKFLPKDKFPCEYSVDRNRCLYQLLELAFMAHNEPKATYSFVDDLSSELVEFCEKIPEAFKAFLDEIIATGFLSNIQKDCLEIYIKIIDAELILRPAIFLDYVAFSKDRSIALRISNSSFNDYKDLFKDMSEILSRLLVLVAGLSNLSLRGSHNLFDPSKKDLPSSLDAFANYHFGKKLTYIDEPRWKQLVNNMADNRLRNAIAHYKTEYDEVRQIITYYPRLEGLKQGKAETITFLEFSRKIFETFRLLHKLNHLIKALFVFYYLHFYKS
jgi:hypothetical protein